MVRTARLSAVLVSRFLLHLQSASLRAVGSLPSVQASSAYVDRSLIFERVVGSLNTSLTPDDFLEQEWEWDEGNDTIRDEEEHAEMLRD